MSEAATDKNPANPHRGEASIAITGRLFTLRPSFEALVAAEEEVGPLFALVERASEGKLTLGEMGALAWHCLPREQRPDRSEVGEALMAMGLVRATQPIRTILSQVLKGGR
ncbi:gene transfer agent family protein [Altererythrobacter arenosus]|uniref:Gene transfer agent family protein n=1 Tax=Altererythrobacter arenosus TaxID=3032592 RepID=A0ABY8FV06_9SPHN|nr:gene transfer agent family protein [Altererythrobacter sp. CAU 1644]WFL78838.1 gene transfer agent family protein [Altererythrobacter sp. CAU 1644]